MRASPGEIAGAATTADAAIGRAGTGVAIAGGAPSGGTPGAEPVGDCAGSTGTAGGAIWPSGASRKTMSTPFLPSPPGSLAAAC